VTDERPYTVTIEVIDCQSVGTLGLNSSGAKKIGVYAGLPNAGDRINADGRSYERKKPLLQLGDRAKPTPEIIVGAFRVYARATRSKM
jgi:hypothetical protein